MQDTDLSLGHVLGSVWKFHGFNEHVIIKLNKTAGVAEYYLLFGLFKEKKNVLCRLIKLKKAKMYVFIKDSMR